MAEQPKEQAPKYVDMQTVAGHANTCLQAVGILYGEKAPEAAAVLTYVRALCSRLDDAGRTLEKLSADDLAAKTAAEAAKAKAEKEAAPLLAAVPDSTDSVS